MAPNDGFLPQTPVRLRRRALLACQKLLHWSALGHVYARTLARSGAVILMYHSVASDDDAVWIDPGNRLAPELFERQMRFLAAHRNVISLDALADSVERRETLPPGTVVLTFDDGYRDNLAVAAPLLSELGLPALIYLPTGSVSGSESPWADELYTIFRNRTAQRLRMNGSEAGFDLSDPAASRAAYASVRDRIIAADFEERGSTLSAVAEQLEPTRSCPRLTLAWDELRSLRERHPNVELGVHSANHIDLTGHDEAVVRRELNDCVTTFERELGEVPRHFAYPYNRRNSVTDRVVADYSLRTAVTAGKDCLISGGRDLMALPRIEAPHSTSLFRFWTSGAYPDLPKKLLGRA